MTSVQKSISVTKATEPTVLLKRTNLHVTTIGVK